MPQSDHPDDHGNVFWMREVILDVIARCSRPRDRVLVLTSHTGEFDKVRFTVLRQVTESASRLGRTVEARMVEPTPHSAPPPAGDPNAPESVPGLIQGPSDPDVPEPVARRTPMQGAGSGWTGPGHPEPVDTVIAYVDSRSVDWVERIPWDVLLSPAGILVFITYSHQQGDNSADFRGLLTSVARRVGLVRLDQALLLPVPGQRYVDLLLFARPLPGSEGAG